MRPMLAAAFMFSLAAGYPCLAETETAVGLIRVVTGKVSLDGLALGNEAVGILTLDPGQTLRVEQGLLELELLPGAYLRAAEDTEIRLLSKNPEQITVELLGGQAILTGSKKLLSNITVQYAGSSARFSQTGYYRWDAVAGPEARLTVVKGKALLETPSGGHQLKAKQAIALTSPAAVEKVRQINKDELMEWSRQRQDDYVLSRRRQKGFADLAIPGTIRQ